MAPAASRCSQAPRTARGRPAPGAGALARHRPRQGPAYPRPPPLARHRARKLRLKRSRDLGGLGGPSRVFVLSRERARPPSWGTAGGSKVSGGGSALGPASPVPVRVRVLWPARTHTHPHPAPGRLRGAVRDPGRPPVAGVGQRVRLVPESPVRACGSVASVPFLAR